MNPNDSESLPLSHHCRRRMSQRGARRAGLLAAVNYGTPYHAGNGTTAFHLDRRSVLKARQIGLRLDEYENLAVIQSPEGLIISVYRITRRPRFWRVAR